VLELPTSRAVLATARPSCFKMVAVHHLGFLWHIWTTHGEYLVVYIIVQTLAMIDVVLII